MRWIAISENSVAARPSELSITTSTSAARRRPTPLPPAEITSCIEAPRIAPGLCSPSAQSTASVMFDLPEPLGPTITLTPGENSSLVRSGNDLNPFISIDLRYISSSVNAKARVRVGRDAIPTSGAELLQRLLGGRLLGRLLAPARARRRPARSRRPPRPRRCARAAGPDSAITS